MEIVIREVTWAGETCYLAYAGETPFLVADTAEVLAKEIESMDSQGTLLDAIRGAENALKGKC